MFPVTVAIDGPAGAGKSTVAETVAKRLGFLYVDSGSMYRAVAYLCIKYNISPDSDEDVVNLLREHSIAFEKDSEHVVRVSIDNQNVTQELRSPKVSGAVSSVAMIAPVRDKLTALQRDFAQRHCVVMDGRDIGTVVIPDATVKVFLTADVHERANRRKSELEHKGFSVSLEEMVASVQQRDRQDQNREVAPLRQADDAIMIDSTGLTVDDVVGEILKLVEQRHVEIRE